MTPLKKKQPDEGQPVLAEAGGDEKPQAPGGGVKKGGGGAKKGGGKGVQEAPGGGGGATGGGAGQTPTGDKPDFFGGSGELPAPVREDDDPDDMLCCGKRCVWRYRIVGLMAPKPVTVTIPVLKKEVELKRKVETPGLVVLEGQVAFRCVCTDKEKYRLETFDIDFDLPPKTTLADVSYVIPGDLNVGAGIAGVAVAQPVLRVDPDVKAVPSDGNGCYLVKVLARVELGMGKLSVNFQGIGTDIAFGPAVSDTFVATYRLCCCRIETTLEPVKDSDEKAKENPVEPDEVLAPGTRDCGCRFTFVEARRVNPAAVIEWKVAALEGGCRFERVTVTAETGNEKKEGVSRNRPGPKIEPIMRDAKGKIEPKPGEQGK